MLTEKGYYGVMLGRSLFQAKGEIGGLKHVFVKLQGDKNELVYPTFGGQVKNPFKGAAKIFAGDLMEYRTDEDGLNPEIYILKTYKVKSQSGTTVNIYRDGYKHIPFVGDILMKAPASIGGTGATSAVTAVSKTKEGADDVWALTVGSELTGLTDGDILVEAVEAGAGKAMVVKNINAVAPCDYDFLYNPVADTDSDDDFKSARYYIAPALGGLMYKNKMSPVPDCCDAFNKSSVNGWFRIEGY